jgi:uncharacterized membrane protein YbhN (UPF0104 family)
MMGYNLIGFGLSYFTPGPQWGGEPVQIYLVKQRHEVSTAHSIAALTLDKLLAWLSQGTLLLVGLGLLLLNDFGQGWGWQGLGPAIGLVAIPTAYLVALWRGRQPFTALLGLLPARFKRKGQAVATDAEAQIGDFCRHQTSVFWQGVFLSFVVWPLLLGLEFWLALHFLGVTLNISQVLIILAASRIAMFRPLPAGLGILEASQVLIMPLLGLDPAVGIALSFLIRARDLLMGGFGLLWGTMLWSRPH